jgi:hypothetical protein
VIGENTLASHPVTASFIFLNSWEKPNVRPDFYTVLCGIVSSDNRPFKPEEYLINDLPFFQPTK